MFALSCSSEDDSIDECTPIECLNDGIQTVDCRCDCPEGYSGIDCSAKLKPQSIKISKIVVKSFPDRKDNGDWWDTPFFSENNNADIYITIENPDDVIIYEHPTYYEDASGLSESYPFILDPPLLITNVKDTHSLILYDYDSNDSDDFISVLLFKPYEETRDGFPTTINVTSPIDTFELDVTVEYSW